MQHDIGAHALLANSRTAALIDPDGGVAWCCWPRFDSAPLFLSILDDVRGGAFSLRPAHEAHVESRAYIGASLVLRTNWRDGEARVAVDDALLTDGSGALVRRARSEGDPVRMLATIRPRGDVRSWAMRIDGSALLIDGDSPVVVHAPAAWSADADGAHCSFMATRDGAATFWLADASAPDVIDDDAIERTLRGWSARLAPTSSAVLDATAERALGASRCRELLGVSAAVLCGLRLDGGGIVAAPTTSLPQWPASARCWDYRYCWLRDASLAGAALLRVGLDDEARALGAFIGDVIATEGVRPLVRVDGTSPPTESLHFDLPGYRGARPVRFGNAAAGQLQVDVAGEVLELARGLLHAGSLPESLANAVTPLARWLVDTWQTPDSGIWEIRGAAHSYTHSRVMAWVGLTSAAEIVEQTEATDRTDQARSWRRTAETIRVATTPPGGNPMQLRIDGGGADASLSVAVMNGFLDPGGATAAATLDLIARDLDDHGLLQRYWGAQDELADPCAPFVFPSFWMASAEAATRRESAGRLEAVASAAGELGLFGEVRDPTTGGPLGNYPQVQSHAALIQALTEPRS